MTEYTILSGCCSLVVQVLEDVNIPPSFAHDAASDVDYYGGRETQWRVLSGKLNMGLHGDVELTQSEIDSIVESNHVHITKQVQWMIDQEDHM